MTEPRFIFFIETVEGDIIKAFTWCRDEASGMFRAAYEAAQTDFQVKKIWAEPVIHVKAC